MTNAAKLFFLFLYFFVTAIGVFAQEEGQKEGDQPVNADSIGQPSPDPAMEPLIRAISDQANIAAQDTSVAVSKNFPDPIKAAMLSAAMPGLGQIYNGSYWKVPIVYGGMMTFGYLIYYFDFNYIKFRNAFLASHDDNPNTINPYENDARINNRLYDRVQFYRRNRDYLMILTTGFYLLNVVEAHVDAHLQSFDLSDDIALKVQPCLINSPYACQFGLCINLVFK